MTFQELETLGLPTICSSNENGLGQLDVISLVNVAYIMVQNYRSSLKKIGEFELQVKLIRFEQ